MKITILKPDNSIGIDGVFHQADCSSLPEKLRVVQWNGTAGHIELTDRENEAFTDIGQYQAIIDQWTAKQAEAEARLADPYYGMTDEEIAIAQAERIRIENVEVARKASGVHKLTVAQAQNYINNRIDSAATAAEKVEAVRDILLKMVPYLLN